MSVVDVLLHAIVAMAAFMQGVTGIGFALIAGPAFLMALDDAGALQITALLCLATALAMAPGARPWVEWPLFRRFALSSLALFPVGLALYAYAEPADLKLMAGLTVGALTAIMVFGGRRASPDGASVGRNVGPNVGPKIGPKIGPSIGPGGDFAAGGLAGVLAGALAMPGPPISLRMTAARLEKRRNRATVQAFFVLIYPIIFAGQAAAAGFRMETVWTALAFLPAVLIGAFGGQFAMAHVSERLFRNIVLVLLATTAVALIVDATTG